MRLGDSTTPTRLFGTTLNTAANITASGDISASGNLYFDKAYGAQAVYHDNDANTGIEFDSDTITIKENVEPAI